MGAKAKLKLKADATILSAQIKKEGLLLAVPPKFKIIKVAGLAVIDPIITNVRGQILDLLPTLDLEHLKSLNLDFLFPLPGGDKNVVLLPGTDLNVSDQDLIKAVKFNPELAEIQRFISEDFDNKMADELTVACENNDFDNDLIKKFDEILSRKSFKGDDFIKLIIEDSGFNKATDEIDLSKTKNDPVNGLRNLLVKLGSILAILLLLFSIFMLVREYIASNRYPSQFRGRILGNVIRTITGIIKKLLNPIPALPATNTSDVQLPKISTDVKNKTKKLLPHLNTMDSVILALTAITAIYLNNRKTAQGIAFTELNEEVETQTCISLKTAREITDEANAEVLAAVAIDPVIRFDTNGFPCPIDNQTPVPHVPFSEKLLDDYCDVDPVFEAAVIKPVSNNNVVGSAYLENLSDFSFNTTVSRGDMLIPFQTIGTIDNDVIHTPIGGTVEKVLTNAIILDNIVDSDGDPINEEINSLKNKFIELNDKKEFMKEFYAVSQYPVLASKLVQTTVSPIDLGRALYEGLVQADVKLKENYAVLIQTLGGEDNVRSKAENEEIEDLQAQLQDKESLLFTQIYKQVDNANTAVLTIPTSPASTVLIDWYFRLLGLLQSFYNSGNPVIVSFQRTINELIIERFFIEGHNINEIRTTINELMNRLDPATAVTNYINDLDDVWDDNMAKRQQQAIKNFVTKTGKPNPSLEEAEKIEIMGRITSMYVFTKDAISVIGSNETYIPVQDQAQRLAQEVNYIVTYFAGIRNEIDDLTTDIEDLIKKIEDMVTSVPPPAVKLIEGVEYEWYGLKGIDRSGCPPPEVENPYLSPHTAEDLNQKRYWLRYCAFATLFSIVPSIVGFAKGLPVPPPSGLPFPVIYIPFFGLMTKWGIFAMGLTITGIFPFPWVLFANQSLDYNTPLGDPTASIKQRIRKTKRQLSEQLRKFNQVTLNVYLDKAQQEIDREEEVLENAVNAKQDHKLQRPIRERSSNKQKNAENKVNYNIALVMWRQKQSDYSIEIREIKGRKYLLERKYDVVARVVGGEKLSDSPDTKDPKIEDMKKTEKLLDAQLDQLDVLIDSVDLVLKPLPITMPPNTNNFGFTVKNKKIIQEVSENSNDNVNQPAVNVILSKNELEADDYMNTNFTPKASDVLNRKKLNSTLRAAMPTLINSDPFPKYENLSPINQAWTPFLVNKWGPVGAKSFGIPV